MNKINIKILSFIFAFAILLSSTALTPQKVEAMGVDEFLSIVGPMATSDMQRTGILASMTLAQAILESGWGTSELCRNANALFGMKATNWSGATYWYNGTDWRAYGSWEESVADHGTHLSTMSRYANLVGERDYRTSCYNVAADGYCPDEGYAESLIKLIEQYNLTQFDVHASLTLDGASAADLGGDFYALIRNADTGLYLTDKDCNVFATEQTNDLNQLWHFKRHVNGSYTISTDSAGFCMDVSNADYKEGTNVQMYQPTGQQNQKFFIYYIEGNFYFKTVAADLLLDMDMATKNVQLYGNSTGVGDKNSVQYKARTFEIISPCLTEEIWNFDYGQSFVAYIRNVDNGTMFTADGDLVYGAEGKYDDNQKWIITANPNGGYEIKSFVNGKVLDVAAAGLASGTSIGLYASNKSKAQSFYFIPNNEGVCIKPVYSPHVVDMDANTKELHIYPYSDEDVQVRAQTFELISEKTYENDEPVNFGDDFYAYLINDAIEKAITDSGSAPTAEALAFNKKQLWHFEYDEKWNAYKITGESGKVMDVSGAGWWDGVPIIMFESNETAAQRFRFYSSGDHYYIKPANTSRILDVDMDTDKILQIWGLYPGQGSNSFTVLKTTKDGKTPVNFGDSFTADIKNASSSLYFTPTDYKVIGGKNSYEWEFIRQSNGSYVIRDPKGNKVLDIEYGLTAYGTPLQTFEQNGTYAQQFFIYEENGAYVIQPAKTGGVLSLNKSTNEISVEESKTDASSVAAQTFVIGAKEVGIKLKDGSDYVDSGDYLIFNKEKTTVKDFLTNFTSTNLKVYNLDNAVASSETRVGTGFKLVANNGDERTVVLVGDLNGNGSLESTDILRLKSQIVYGTNNTAIMKKAADMDENGRVNTTDYLRLKAYFIGGGK